MPDTPPGSAAMNGETMSETRAEALQWCKDRALEYVDAGDLPNAFASFASDVRKHPETESLVDAVTHLGMPLMMSGHLDTPQKMREWIEGFN